jgi:hypothetical protein
MPGTRIWRLVSLMMLKGRPPGPAWACSWPLPSYQIRLTLLNAAFILRLVLRALSIHGFVPRLRFVPRGLP